MIPIQIKKRQSLGLKVLKNKSDQLSYHGWITKKKLTKLTEEGFEQSNRIVKKPEKIITFGVFGKLDTSVSFSL